MTEKRKALTRAQLAQLEKARSGIPALKKDWSRTKHGFYEVIRYSHTKGARYWLCVCVCGKEFFLTSGHIKKGSTKSCGCMRLSLISEKQKRHGLSSSAEHRIWTGMLDRCTNENTAQFENYGGRGIRVCARWKNFENFYADMGPRPSAAHSLDRIDNSAGYEPLNCRWATKEQQGQNKRTTVYVTLNGEQLCVAEAARRVGINYHTLLSRLARGWPEDKALTRRRA